MQRAIFTNGLYDDVTEVSFDLDLLYNGIDENGDSGYKVIENLCIHNNYDLKGDINTRLRLVQMELAIKSDILKKTLYDTDMILFSFSNMIMKFKNGNVFDVNNCSDRQYAQMLGLITIIMNTSMNYSLD